MMSDLPAFEISNLETGQKFKVWADGRIDGFGRAACIINRIPSIIATAEQDVKVEAGLVTLVKLVQREAVRD